jgi:hypothetical protein
MPALIEAGDKCIVIARSSTASMSAVPVQRPRRLAAAEGTTERQER